MNTILTKKIGSSPKQRDEISFMSGTCENILLKWQIIHLKYLKVRII